MSNQGTTALSDEKGVEENKTNIPKTLHWKMKDAVRSNL